MLVVNGVEIATPKSFEVGLSDIDGETNRNARGEMLRDRIATKRKLNCEWGTLNEDDCSQVLKAVKDIFFEVTYPDPMEGRMLTKTFYVGDRTTPALSYINGEIRWKGLKMNFIEK
ncbi:DUF6711 family protein [Clostridium perfringens]